MEIKEEIEENIDILDMETYEKITETKLTYSKTGSIDQSEPLSDKEVYNMVEIKFKEASDHEYKSEMNFKKSLDGPFLSLNKEEKTEKKEIDFKIPEFDKEFEDLGNEIMKQDSIKIDHVKVDYPSINIYLTSNFGADKVNPSSTEIENSYDEIEKGLGKNFKFVLEDEEMKPTNQEEECFTILKEENQSEAIVPVEINDTDIPINPKNIEKTVEPIKNIPKKGLFSNSLNFNQPKNVKIRFVNIEETSNFISNQDIKNENYNNFLQ